MFQKNKQPLEIVLAKNLKSIRTRRKISREDLAHHTGTTEKTIIDIEDEVYTPNLGLLIRIAKALRCSLNDLIPIDEIS